VIVGSIIDLVPVTVEYVVGPKLLYTDKSSTAHSFIRMIAIIILITYRIQ